jgi:hypothetical protein
MVNSERYTIYDLLSSEYQFQLDELLCLNLTAPSQEFHLQSMQDEIGEALETSLGIF